MNNITLLLSAVSALPSWRFLLLVLAGVAGVFIYKLPDILAVV